MWHNGAGHWEAPPIDSGNSDTIMNLMPIQRNPTPPAAPPQIIDLLTILGGQSSHTTSPATTVSATESNGIPDTSQAGVQDHPE
jgi:hypothetical protein